MPGDAEQLLRVIFSVLDVGVVFQLMLVLMVAALGLNLIRRLLRLFLDEPKPTQKYGSYRIDASSRSSEIIIPSCARRRDPNHPRYD